MLQLPLVVLALVSACDTMPIRSLVLVDEPRSVATDSVPAPGAEPRIDGPSVARADGDTTRPRAVEYSDWYERRATIHKRASYATLPLFAIQYVSGSQLYAKSTDAPGWAKAVHGPAATGVAALFAVNSVTGVWNLWDARHDPEGRGRRTVHALLMLVSDAGFTYTGILSDQAERSPDKRRLHRQVGLTSMGIATVGYLVMALPIGRN